MGIRALAGGLVIVLLAGCNPESSGFEKIVVTEMGPGSDGGGSDDGSKTETSQYAMDGHCHSAMEQEFDNNGDPDHVISLNRSTLMQQDWWYWDLGRNVNYQWVDATYDTDCETVVYAFDPSTAETERNIQAEITDRCDQTYTEDYGQSTTLFCIQDDLEGWKKLAPYREDHSSIVTRCTNQFRNYGFSTVLFCVEKDVEAAGQL